MWNTILLGAFIFQCLTNNIFIKNFQLPFQQWKKQVCHKIHCSKNWTFIPYELQPYEIDFLVVV